MEISLTELQTLISNGSRQTHSLKIGTNYFIQTVTFFYTGRLVAVTDTDIVLEDAAWIADTGRFADCLQTGKLLEVEPFRDPAIIGRGVFVAATVWPHPLPRVQQ